MQKISNSNEDIHTPEEEEDEEYTLDRNQKQDIKQDFSKPTIDTKKEVKNDPKRDHPRIPQINSLSEQHQILPSLNTNPSLSVNNRSDSTSSLNGMYNSPTTLPMSKQYHLPQISFNTSIFKEGKSNEPSNIGLKLNNANFNHISASNSVRSASFDINGMGMTLPPINKRRLLDERRHSSAQPIYKSQNSQSNNSHPNLSNLSSNSPNFSPLLLSNQASRNNSISHFEFGLNCSNTNSRRSSIAPDFFPNPLINNNQYCPTSASAGSNQNSGYHKRNISQNSAFNSPLLTPATRFSMSSIASLKNNSQSDITMINDDDLKHKQNDDHKFHQYSKKIDDKSESSSSEKEEQLTKISVSSLID